MARGVVAMLLLALVGTARAEKPASAMAKAKLHFHQGAAYYKAERYDEAIAEYRAAYALVPLPDLLFNLAQAFRLKHDLQAAVDHYHQFLATNPKGDAAEEARRQLIAVEAALHEQARRKAEAEAKAAEKPAMVEPSPIPAPPLVVATKPAPAPEKKRRGWVAGVVVGVVLVAGAAIGVGLALGLEKDPQASLGVIK